MITVKELLEIIHEAEKKYGKEAIHSTHVYLTLGNEEKTLGFDYCSSAEFDEEGIENKFPQHLILTN